jgi:hypothetical protein
VSEEFYKSLDPAPPIRKEVVMNTAGKGMQMNGIPYIDLYPLFLLFYGLARVPLIHIVFLPY